MALPVAAIAEARFVGVWQEQRIMLTTHWQVTVPDSGTNYFQDMAGLAGELLSVVNPLSVLNTYLACQPDSYTLLHLDVQSLAPLRQAFVRTNVNADGIVASQGIGTLTGRVTLASLLTFVGQYGTKQIGPVPENMSDEGRPTNVYANLLADLGTALITPLAPPGTAMRWAPAIYHRETGDASTPVLRRVSDVLGTQRRRILHVGI